MSTVVRQLEENIRSRQLAHVLTMPPGEQYLSRNHNRYQLFHLYPLILSIGFHLLLLKSQLRQRHQNRPWQHCLLPRQACTCSGLPHPCLPFFLKACPSRRACYTNRTMATKKTQAEIRRLHETAWRASRKAASMASC